MDDEEDEPSKSDTTRYTGELLLESDFSSMSVGSRRRPYKSPSCSDLTSGHKSSATKTAPSVVQNPGQTRTQSSVQNPAGTQMQPSVLSSGQGSVTQKHSQPSSTQLSSSSFVLSGDAHEPNVLPTVHTSSPGNLASAKDVLKSPGRRFQRLNSYSGLTPAEKSSFDAVSVCRELFMQTGGIGMCDAATTTSTTKHVANITGIPELAVASNTSKIPATAPKTPSTNRQQVLESWKGYIRGWYPKLLTRAYFMPHVYMHRVHRDTVQHAGVDVSVPKTPVDVQPKKSKHTLLNCFVRDDRAQQHVLHCLRAVADGRLPNGHEEVMFVLSQLDFGDYMNDQCFAPAASLFPRTEDLKRQRLGRGDFDVLILHRVYGIIVGEIKSFGEKAAVLKWTEDDFDAELIKKFKTMLKLDKKSEGDSTVGQLMKARRVLEYLTKDQKPSVPRVKVTLILPGVSRHQLRRALAKDSIVKEALCTDLGLPPTADPVDVCLCSDQMSDGATPWHFDDNSLQQLDTWWQRVVCADGPDPAMCDNAYEELVAKFAGPATVVKLHCAAEPRLKVVNIRTEEEALEEVHERLTQIALYPAQIDVLQENADLRFLTGPPGTGKSVMLVLKALEWLKQGHFVFVVGLEWKSHAASHNIHNQMMKTVKETLAKEDPDTLGRLRLNLFDVETLEDHLLLAEVVNTLQRSLPEAYNELHIVCDEAEGKLLDAFYTKLTSSTTKFDSLCIWAANISSEDVPEHFTITTLTEPLRCPPSVVREVGKAAKIQQGSVPAYTIPEAPPMTDGPPVKIITHTQGQGGHNFPLIHDCEDCGMEIGQFLIHEMNVGKPRITTHATSDPPIRFRDVMILTFFPLRDEKHDAKGNVLQKTDGLVRGVRNAKLPVTVLEKGDNDTLAMVAKMEGRDAITMTSVQNVYGLERKVVVWVGRKVEGDDFGGRLHAMSRATSQLIWIVR